MVHSSQVYTTVAMVLSFPSGHFKFIWSWTPPPCIIFGECITIVIFLVRGVRSSVHKHIIVFSSQNVIVIYKNALLIITVHYHLTIDMWDRCCVKYMHNFVMDNLILST